MSDRLEEMHALLIKAQKEAAVFQATITRLREERDAARKEAECRGICELCTHEAVKRADILREERDKTQRILDHHIKATNKAVTEIASLKAAEIPTAEPEGDK